MQVYVNQKRSLVWKQSYASHASSSWAKLDAFNLLNTALKDLSERVALGWIYPHQRAVPLYF